jgi:outer membrane immunogenic protein
MSTRVGLIFMNKFILAAAFTSTILTGAATAADLIMPTDEVVVSNSATTDWSGFYAGLHIGGATGTMDLPPVPAGVISIDSYEISGGLVGGQVGANAQFGNLVVGVEGDASWTNVFGRGTLDIGVLTVGTEAKVNALGSVRGRVGFAADSILFYATAGVAAASVTGTAFEEFAGTRTVLGTPKVGHMGWVIGAGAEAMVTDNISIKAEYLYHKFGTEAYDYGAGPVDQSFNLHTVKVGANFHF